MAYDLGMLTRRRASTAYRSRPVRSGRSLPASMDGTKRTEPIRRPDPNYPTIPVKEDK